MGGVGCGGGVGCENGVAMVVVPVDVVAAAAAGVHVVL